MIVSSLAIVVHTSHFGLKHSGRIFREHATHACGILAQGSADTVQLGETAVLPGFGIATNGVDVVLRGQGLFGWRREPRLC